MANKSARLTVVSNRHQPKKVSIKAFSTNTRTVAQADLLYDAQICLDASKN